MTKLNALFSEGTTTNTAGGANQLSGTARLTELSTQVARDILQTADGDLEKYEQLLLDSQQSHDRMDELISEAYELQTVDISFLDGISDEDGDKMIKSQQSKRSRTKAKEMTMHNFLTMLTGAVAENLLRVAFDKPKQSGGGGARGASLELTEEELQAYANDKELLARAIRNVQSKKSIAKSKADHSEESERWVALLEVEATLKGIRDGQTVEATKAVETNSKLEEMVSDIDISKLKAADAKEMLEAVKEMLATR